MANDTDSVGGTRKPDDAVGTRGDPAVSGGHQSPEQAAITGLEPDGRTDADRKKAWSEAGGVPGRNPAPVGGSSDGQSDRKR
ncbi:hypothetical protein G3T14_14305 [Methylobacterium sp. BTF04]|uniref:hypothetical protein n=1 Tax=Methylobacterium sp. BTF04 TaxID=2708300 RepID=UPI0013D55C24|nr:hypothetical protein [Methylobacterium sp. BTF04]NEU13294.1 hypothetical protein [Methylobacterium sp. BTF04]